MNELKIAILGIKFAVLAMAISIAGMTIPLSFEFILNPLLRKIIAGISLIILIDLAIFLIYIATKIEIPA